MPYYVATALSSSLWQFCLDDANLDVLVTFFMATMVTSICQSILFTRFFWIFPDQSSERAPSGNFQVHRKCPPDGRIVSLRKVRENCTQASVIVSAPSSVYSLAINVSVDNTWWSTFYTYFAFMLMHVWCKNTASPCRRYSDSPASTPSWRLTVKVP